jgi:hypothetical protein
MKAHHECKYRDQGDLLFRNQTAFAAQRAEDSWRKRSKSNQRALSVSSDSQEPSPRDSTSPKERTRQPSFSGARRQSCQSSTIYDVLPGITRFDGLSVAPNLKPDLRRLAYERFLYDFVILESPNHPPDEPSDSLYSFIPVLYNRAAENSCVANVVDGLAYVNFANRSNAPQAEALGEECIGKAVVMLSRIIADRKQAASDEALCAVYLMGVYEVTTV